MRKGLIAGVVVLGLLFLFGLGVFGWYYGIRNELVGQDENVNSAWSQVQNVYQRRADLIPNLVRTVQGYAAHEQDTLIQVTEARSKVNNINLGNAVNDPTKMEQFLRAQGELSSALSRLMVVVERYPDLKANENFRDLQVQLEGTENRVTVERMRYNEAARTFNTRIRQFPASIVAAIASFQKKTYFEAQPGAEKAPEVNFSR
ncbi:MAG: LemA family protein [Acidobacteria bacterium]|nr:LemA family protein [Acidobacteriota bacterium]